MTLWRRELACATADAFALFERLERKLESRNSQLMRAAIKLARGWRIDRYLRDLEAMKVGANICVYTNENLTVEAIDGAT